MVPVEGEKIITIGVVDEVSLDQRLKVQAQVWGGRKEDVQVVG